MSNRMILQPRPDIDANYYELLVVLDQRITELNAPSHMRLVNRSLFRVRRWFLRKIGRWEDEKTKIVERVERDVYRRSIRGRNK